MEAPRFKRGAFFIFYCPKTPKTKEITLDNSTNY